MKNWTTYVRQAHHTIWRSHRIFLYSQLRGFSASNFLDQIQPHLWVILISRKYIKVLDSLRRLMKAQGNINIIQTSTTHTYTLVVDDTHMTTNG